MYTNKQTINKLTLLDKHKKDGLEDFCVSMVFIFVLDLNQAVNKS